MKTVICCSAAQALDKVGTMQTNTIKAVVGLATDISQRSTEDSSVLKSHSKVLYVQPNK